jgi:hypothetical protein
MKGNKARVLALSKLEARLVARRNQVGIQAQPMRPSPNNKRFASNEARRGLLARRERCRSTGGQSSPTTCPPIRQSLVSMNRAEKVLCALHCEIADETVRVQDPHGTHEDPLF